MLTRPYGSWPGRFKAIILLLTYQDIVAIQFLWIQLGKIPHFIEK